MNYKDNLDKFASNMAQLRTVHNAILVSIVNDTEPLTFNRIYQHMILVSKDFTPFQNKYYNNFITIFYKKADTTMKQTPKLFLQFVSRLLTYEFDRFVDNYTTQHESVLFEHIANKGAAILDEFQLLNRIFPKQMYALATLLDREVVPN